MSNCRANSAKPVCIFYTLGIFEGFSAKFYIFSVNS